MTQKHIWSHDHAIPGDKNSPIVHKTIPESAEQPPTGEAEQPPTGEAE